MSSETKTQEPNENTINVILGENTSEIIFQNGMKCKIYPLTFLDLAYLENFTGLALSELSSSKSISKLINMLYILWLSLKKNKDFTMTHEELGELFSLKHNAELTLIIGKIIELSGLASKKEEGTIS